MITRDYHQTGQIHWQRWTREYWTALFTVTDATGRFRYYKDVFSPRCHQCRRLPARERWTGARVCACGNPYINRSGAYTPRPSRRQP